MVAKCQKNVPKCLSGLPGSLPEKCPKSVWKVSWCWGWRWKNVHKMSKKCQKKCPQTFSRHFFDTFWQIENQKGARARSARPLLRGGQRLPPLYLPNNFKKVSKKCLENVWGTLFFSFSGHFSSASPSTRTLSRNFLDIFLGGCQEVPKSISGHF